MGTYAILVVVGVAAFLITEWRNSEFEDDFAMVKTVAPREMIGKSLAEGGVWSRHGITVVGIKRPGEDFTYATQDTVIRAGDLLIVSGRIQQVEAFADHT